MSFDVSERGSPGYELEKVRDELKQVRKELRAFQIVSYGLLLVVLLNLFGVRRAMVVGAFGAVCLVIVFLQCRWGLGDNEMSLPQSIGVTLSVAAVFLLTWLLWGGR